MAAEPTSVLTVTVAERFVQRGPELSHPCGLLHWNQTRCSIGAFEALVLDHGGVI